MSTIEQYKETNRRLNRRIQVIESVLARDRDYNIKWARYLRAIWYPQQGKMWQQELITKFEEAVQSAYAKGWSDAINQPTMHPRKVKPRSINSNI